MTSLLFWKVNEENKIEGYIEYIDKKGGKDTEFVTLEIVKFNGTLEPEENKLFHKIRIISKDEKEYILRESLTEASNWKKIILILLKSLS